MTADERFTAALLFANQVKESGYFEGDIDISAPSDDLYRVLVSQGGRSVSVTITTNVIMGAESNVLIEAVVGGIETLNAL